MKSSKILAVALFSCMAVSSDAHATAFSQNFGTVADTNGPITMTLGPSDSLNYNASGILPSNSEIVFSYSSNKTAGGIDLVAGGNISTANVSAISFGSAVTNSAAPVLAYANLGNSTGSVTIQNSTSTAESFQALLSSMFSSGSRASFTVGYAVSSVPLPASLVLFATGLVALIGFSASKKNRGSV